MVTTFAAYLIDTLCQDSRNQFEENLYDVGHGHHRSRQGQSWNQARERERNEVTKLHRQNSHGPDDPETIAKIGERLDVTGPEQRLVDRFGLPYPSSVKSLRVFTSEGPILHQAPLFQRGQLGYENQQRSCKNAQRKHEQTDVTPNIVAES